MVADHALDDREEECFIDSYSENSPIQKSLYHPLLMFKDFNAEGKLKEDMTFMTNADVPSLLLKGLVETPINPFTNKEIPLDTTEIKSNGVIISTDGKHKPEYHNQYTFDVDDGDWWLVKDNIFQSKNWTKASPPSKGK